MQDNANLTLALHEQTKLQKTMHLKSRSDDKKYNCNTKTWLQKKYTTRLLYFISKR